MSINPNLRPIVESKEAVLGAKIFRESLDPATQYHLKAVLHEASSVAMSEDVVGKVKSHFARNWKKYVAGAVTAGAGALAYKNRDEIKKGYNELEAKTKAKIKELKADLRQALADKDEAKADQVRKEIVDATKNVSKVHEAIGDVITQESALSKVKSHLKKHWKKYALAGGAVAGAVGGKYAYDKYNEKGDAENGEPKKKSSSSEPFKGYKNELEAVNAKIKEMQSSGNSNGKALNMLIKRQSELIKQGQTV
jgi:hypothetical protein